MQLLSKELVSPEYRDRLRQDLSRAKVCRFLVAYISKEGLNAINRPIPILINALRDQRSFGVASISCACGYEPLIDLQDEFGPGFPVRLKYFLDPVIKPDHEPAISLFHSKLVYLFLEQEWKSVVYIGSHNWTARALGPGSPRNAEASLRFEFEFAPDHLEGIGNSTPAEINRHLLDAWNAPACFPANSDSETAFQQWIQKACKKTHAPVKEITIILAVCKTAPQPIDWLTLHNSAGIYMQALEEDEGKRVYESNEALVFVWESRTSLQAGRQPFILKCRKTSSNAGSKSALAGSNSAPSPMEGFKAIILDQAKLSALQQSQSADSPPVRIWSGRDIRIFDFEFPAMETQSSRVDAGIEPLYQIYLQTEVVVFPADDRAPRGASHAWERETFAVAESKDAARFEESPGYFVPPDVEKNILSFFRNFLQVEPHQAKVLPYSEVRSTVGKRVSSHPLHDTYIGREPRSSREGFYSKSSPGMLIPDIEELSDPPIESQNSVPFGDPLSRVQRVFTMPLKDLLAIWQDTAHRLLS